jgi:stage II sporulation protein D
MTSKKSVLFLCLMLFLAMMLIPLASLGGGKPADSRSGSGGEASSSQAPKATGGQFLIRDTSTGKILTVGDDEFVRGTVACELSPDAPTEALKAQAVAAYTYYSRIRATKRAQNASYDFDAAPSNWNVYVPDDARRQRWGNDYEKNEKAIGDAASAVAGQVLKYDGALIDATYFATSAGNTEDAADVWGSKCAYLVSVASPWDAFAGGYQSTASFTEEDFRARVLKTAANAVFSGDASNWVGAIDRSPAGMVKSIVIGERTLTGSQVRSAFGLRSANFTISHDGGKFTFTVKGYGHGVGMSQTGAEGMARQGATYRDILSWYYPGTTLTTI